MSHEANGMTDDWYTPKYIFDALGVEFDADVAAAPSKANVPAKEFIYQDALSLQWNGFIWMNPPWSKRSDKIKWVQKFADAGNGIALMPDRTSAPWWQYFARCVDAVLFVDGKIKFERPDGSIGEQPGNGSTLFAMGDQGVAALFRAQLNQLGIVFKR